MEDRERKARVGVGGDKQRDTDRYIQGKRQRGTDKRQTDSNRNRDRAKYKTEGNRIDWSFGSGGLLEK